MIEFGAFTFQLKEFDEWKSINWLCMEQSRDMWDLDTRSPLSGKMSSSSSKYPSGKDWDMGERASKRMQKETLKRCRFQCGQVLANTVISGSSASSNELKNT